MNRQPFEKPPRWWAPKLSRPWIGLWRPIRKRQQLKVQRLLEIEIRGVEHLRGALAQGQGVLVTPNHSSHADCFSVFEVAEQAGVLFHIMVAWQVFQRSSRTNPTPELLRLMDRLERAIYWRPRSDMPLAERIYHLAQGALALKEIEFLGSTSSGPLTRRVADLTDFILSRIETRHALTGSGGIVPERIKTARQHLINRLVEMPEDHPERGQCQDDLEDVFLAVQLFSYPGDYVAQRPGVERIAETLDKFEEDILGATTATIRGTRRATVTLGEPVPVLADRGKNAAASLTRLLEERVQAILNLGETTTDKKASRAGD